MGFLADERFRLYIRTNDSMRAWDFDGVLVDLESIVTMCRNVETDEKGEIFKRYIKIKDDFDRKLAKRELDISNEKKAREKTDPLNAGNYEKIATFEAHLWHARELQRFVFDELLAKNLFPLEIREKIVGERPE